MDHKTAHWWRERERIKSECQTQASLRRQKRQHNINKEMNQYVNYVALVIAQYAAHISAVPICSFLALCTSIYSFIASVEDNIK